MNTAAPIPACQTHKMTEINIDMIEYLSNDVRYEIVG